MLVINCQKGKKKSKGLALKLNMDAIEKMLGTNEIPLTLINDQTTKLDTKVSFVYNYISV